jgi:hypothetical protein
VSPSFLVQVTHQATRRKHPVYDTKRVSTLARRDQIFLPCLKKKIHRWTRNQNLKGRIVIERGRGNERTQNHTQEARGESTHTLDIIKLNCLNRHLRHRLLHTRFLLLLSPSEDLVRIPFPPLLQQVPSRLNQIIHSPVLPYDQHHPFLRPLRHRNYPYPIPQEVVYHSLDLSRIWRSGSRNPTPCISLIRLRLSRRRMQGKKKGTIVQCAARVSASHTGYQERNHISYQSVDIRCTR